MLQTINNPPIIELLEKHGLRKTAIRTQVLHVFLNRREALSHAEVEDLLKDADRITVYRTLKTFEDKGLIHKAIDGGGKAKYALCHNGCSEDAHHDHHAHFHCYDCGKTICLDTVTAPKVQAPSKFRVVATHLVLTGQCDACSE